MFTESKPRWCSGDHLVIAWSSGIAVVDSSVSLQTAERLWTRVRIDPQLGSFLQTLAEASPRGFLDLPPFAIAVMEGDRCHVAVRGSAVVEVFDGSEVEVVTGAGIPTWAERVIHAPRGLRMALQQPGEEDGPIADGLVRGSAVVLGEIGLAGAGVDHLEVAPVEEQVTPEPVPEPVLAAVASDEPPASFAQPVLQVESPTLAEEDSQLVPDDLAEAGDSELVAPEAVAPEVVPPAPADPNPYLSLWDQSMAIDINAAAVREGEEPSGGAAPSTSDAEQLFGETVAEEGEVQIAAAPAGGPEVQARMCDRGHGNPLERDTCFICAQPVSGPVRRMPRPQLGWLRVEGGERVPLRGPIVAGRNPSSSVLKLTEQPRLLAVPQPHVSSTHVAFLLEGWRVMVQDLHSRNGTYLRRHNKEPVRLPETPFPLVPGDLIDLGKGTFIHLDGIP